MIATICPDARVIDISHGIPRHDVQAGALVLRAALGYMPAGVHLAVVDPDVGAERRAVAFRAGDGRLFVGPDNGVMWLAAQSGGGVTEAVDIARSRFRLEPVAATFHGRDIFAPVTARLACGEPLASLGEPCDPGELVRIELPRAHIEDGALVAHVIHVDRFGNLQLDVEHEELPEVGLSLGRSVELRSRSTGTSRAHYVRTFADVHPGELLLYEDSYRRLAVAESHGDAARRLLLGAGDELRIRPS